MKNMFNKEDPAPAAAGPAKKWGAVKNVVGTTKASNFVDRIREAQKKQGGVPGVPKPPQPPVSPQAASASLEPGWHLLCCYPCP
jgi:hypothetical protein